MSRNRSSYQWIGLVAASLLAFALVGCGGGSGGGTGSAGASVATTGFDAGAAALSGSSALNMTITGVSVSSPPVVNFTVTNQSGVALAGLTAADLRFNIAKLVPGSNGEPSSWQNYINVASGGAVQGSQERSGAGFAFGTLVDNVDGSYTYTFATDITSAAKNPCPAPCTTAEGKALDISYQPSATHRVTIQQANGAYPKSSGVFDFVPAGGNLTKRDVVLTSTCNQCHSELTAPHGTQVDTRLCVTCHNPGSWVAGTPNVPVDFKVMIHRIHRGANLPSVQAGGTFSIAGVDYSKAVFPQDVRNCTKCHSGTLSAQGDNWKNQPSIAACGSCHDDRNFGAAADPAKPTPHLGGVVSDNSTCLGCHGVGKVAGADIVLAHGFPTRLKAAAAKFKFNIISVTPTTPGSTPVITFSVTDPTNADKPYDIKSDAPFTAGANSTLTIKAGWTSAGIADIGNDGQAFGQPISINLLGNAAVVAGATAGTFTVTATGAIPATQTGTLRVIMHGNPAGDVTAAGLFIDQLPVKSVFKDFAITGAVAARRTVVDAAKCDVCHDVLSMHGRDSADQSRVTDEPGACVVCHNPNATDGGQRPGLATAVAGTDGKLEESIDFKTMIHGIHASQTAKGGKREKGLVIYRTGPGGSVIVKDFSSLVFPGKLNDCALCHAGTSYQLTGIWASPTANGILGNTISTGASTTDPSDNLRISPIAAVCSSCHDNAVVNAHMVTNGANFPPAPPALEFCPICHGPGNIADLKVVHGVK